MSALRLASTSGSARKQLLCLLAKPLNKMDNTCIVIDLQSAQLVFDLQKKSIATPQKTLLPKI